MISESPQETDFRRLAGRFARLLVFPGALLPILLVTLTIIVDGVNVPFLDQWDTSFPRALETLDGTLTFPSLLAFHNEHRIFFTNLVTVVSARFFGWNLYLELFFTLALAVVVFLLVLRLLRQEMPQALLPLLVPFSALIFSLRTKHTWTTSFQSCFLWVMLFFLLALLSLRRGRVGWKPLLLAAVFSVCATVSLANGLLAWLVIGVGLPLLGYRKWRYLLFWAAAALATIALYYAPGRPASALVPSLELLPRLVEYGLVYLGGVFVPESWDGSFIPLLIPLMLLCVALFLANFTYLWRKGFRERIVPWLLLAGFVAGSALMTAFGRLPFMTGFPFQALSERYVIIAVFWWVSLLALGAAVVHAACRRGSRFPARLLALVNLATFGVLVVLWVYTNAYHLEHSRIVNPDSEVCYGQYLITRDASLPCLAESRMIYPDAWLPRLEELARRRLAMFKTPQLAVSLNGLPFRIIQVGVPEPFYTTYADAAASLLNPSRPAFFEHPPARVEYALNLPDGYASVRFSASLWIDPTNVLKDPGALQDGAVFSLAVVDEAGAAHRSEPVLFDPHVNAAPLPFAFDLSDYRGQALRLQLQTESGESVAYDWALWINPTIHLSD